MSEANTVAGKSVLVTGGSGFIGSELVDKAINQHASEVRVLDNDEKNVFRLKKKYGDDVSVFIGDIRNRERVDCAMSGVDAVFHAAAIKHVGLSEKNPYEAAKTNILGTKNLTRSAISEGVDSFTAISTDKASNPISVMGATKLVMERVVTSANTRETSTRFNCVRFGNVLGAPGSVVQIFLDQIEAGGPITITDPDMTRFIMPVGRAVTLTFGPQNRMKSGDIVVLKMPAFRVGDLAKGMRDRFARKFGHDRRDIDLDIIGKRPAERIHEKLISGDEISNAVELDDAFLIKPHIADGTDYNSSLDTEYSSADAKALSPETLAEMVGAEIDVGGKNRIASEIE